MSSTLLPLLTLMAFVLSANAAEQRIGSSGYGPARIGMTRASLQEAMGARLVDQIPGAESDGCTYVLPEGTSQGVAYMIIDGRLARIDVDTQTVATISGAHVGTTESELRALYPGIETSPHFYNGPDWHYMVLTSPDGRLAIRFETDGARVVRWYAGKREAIEYVDGCA
ncbi:hypothetical protein AB4059_00310 [Lysobacter sp. 2RAF19]